MNSNIYGKGIICNRDTREEGRNKNWINYFIIIVLVLFLILLIFSVGFFIHQDSPNVDFDPIVGIVFGVLGVLGCFGGIYWNESTYKDKIKYFANPDDIKQLEQNKKDIKAKIQEINDKNWEIRTEKGKILLKQNSKVAPINNDVQSKLSKLQEELSKLQPQLNNLQYNYNILVNANEIYNNIKEFNNNFIKELYNIQDIKYLDNYKTFASNLGNEINKFNQYDTFDKQFNDDEKIEIKKFNGIKSIINNTEINNLTQLYSALHKVDTFKDTGILSLFDSKLKEFADLQKDYDKINEINKLMKELEDTQISKDDYNKKHARLDKLINSLSQSMHKIDDIHKKELDKARQKNAELLAQEQQLLAQEQQLIAQQQKELEQKQAELLAQKQKEPEEQARQSVAAILNVKPPT